jgi:hypothetical protein
MALRLFDKTRPTRAVFWFEKYLIMFSALVPVPEAMIAMFLIICALLNLAENAALA